MNAPYHLRALESEAVHVFREVAAEGLAARLRLEQDDELRAAFAALDDGEQRQGLDALIGAIADARDERREDLRRAVVGVLDQLGVEHPVARESRRKLASALY